MSDETKNHTNEGKGKEKDRKRREKSDGCTPTFSWQHWRCCLNKESCLMVEVYLAVMFLKIRLKIAVIILLPL